MRKTWDELGIVILIVVVLLPVLIWRGSLATKILSKAETVIETANGLQVVHADGRAEYLEDAIMRGGRDE